LVKVDNHGTIGDKRGDVKKSMDSADLLQRNMRG